MDAHMEVQQRMIHLIGNGALHNRFSPHLAGLFWLPLPNSSQMSRERHRPLAGEGISYFWGRSVAFKNTFADLPGFCLRTVKYTRSPVPSAPHEPYL